VWHSTSTDLLTLPAHTLFSSQGVASNFNRPPHISCTHTVLLSGCSIQLQPTSSHCLPIHCSPLRVWHSTSTDLLTLPAHTLFSSQGAASNFNRPTHISPAHTLSSSQGVAFNFNRPPHIACPHTVLLSGCSIQLQPTSSHFSCPHTVLLTFPAHILFSSQGVASNFNRPPHISPAHILFSSHFLPTYCSPLRVWHSTSTDLLTFPAHTLSSSQCVAFNFNRPPHISCPHTVLLSECG